MTDRITRRDLEAVVARINRATDSPEVSYVREGDRFTAQIGNYHLDGAYGGWALSRMMNEGGGVTDVFRSGHMPKRELYNRMQAFLDGLEACE